MQIKRFEAKNMTAALCLIKKELGPEAVILSARSLKKGSGIFGTYKQSGVEVTAATDTYDIDKTKINTFHRNEGYGDPLMMPTNTNSSAEQKRMTQNYLATTGIQSSERNYGHHADEKPSLEKRLLLALYHQLLSQDVDPGIAADVIEGFKIMPAAVEKLQHGEIRPLLASLFSHMGMANGSLGLKHKPSVVALIGTTGVGKTSMIAKLAAHYTLEHHKNVALMSIDDYRIAAIEQLNAYARIIGLPLKMASTPAELKARLREFKGYDLILIDTPGFSQNNTRQIQEIASYLEKVNHIQIQLVLSASTKQKDLLDTITKLGPIGPQHLIFTKLDESISYGNLLNILLRSNIPMSYLSRGQKIPDDFETACVETLADLILSENTEFAPEPAGNAAMDSTNLDHPLNNSGGPGPAEPFVVAKRNSNVYHIAGCKWTNKVKHKNLIIFESASAAERKNYLPCRNCNPDRPDHDGVRSFARDKVNMARY
jgi:flagellar biosynthesis protein FlhF